MYDGRFGFLDENVSDLSRMQGPFFTKDGTMDYRWKDHFIFRFPNNYGASVIRGYGSYGGDDGLWELAVLKFNEKGESTLCCDTPITGDVEGYLEETDVAQLLKEIKELEADYAETSSTNL